METVVRKIRLLRTWFVVMFLVQSVAGTAIAAAVLDGLRQVRFFRVSLAAATPALTVASGMLASLVLLALGLVVFASLIERRPWARLVMLAVGWITVGSAVIGLLAMPVTVEWVELAGRGAGTHLALLRFADLASKALDIAYWGWLIAVLQFNPAVRAAFRECAGPTLTP